MAAHLHRSMAALSWGRVPTVWLTTRECPHGGGSQRPWSILVVSVLGLGSGDGISSSSCAVTTTRRATMASCAAMMMARHTCSSWHRGTVGCRAHHLFMLAQRAPSTRCRSTCSVRRIPLPSAPSNSVIEPRHRRHQPPYL